MKSDKRLKEDDLFSLQNDSEICLMFGGFTGDYQTVQYVNFDYKKEALIERSKDNFDNLICAFRLKTLKPKN